jgi:hypothetical protein
VAAMTVEAAAGGWHDEVPANHAGPQARTTAPARFAAGPPAQAAEHCSSSLHRWIVLGYDRATWQRARLGAALSSARPAPYRVQVKVHVGCGAWSRDADLEGTLTALSELITDRRDQLLSAASRTSLNTVAADGLVPPPPGSPMCSVVVLLTRRRPVLARPATPGRSAWLRSRQWSRDSSVLVPNRLRSWVRDETPSFG